MIAMCILTVHVIGVMKWTVVNNDDCRLEKIRGIHHESEKAKSDQTSTSYLKFFRFSALFQDIDIYQDHSPT